MALKVVFVCVLALMVQSIVGKSCLAPAPKPNCGISKGSIVSGGCVPVVKTVPSIPISRPVPLPYPITAPSNCVSIDIPQSGGALEVTSVGPITPTGIALATEMGLAGDLLVSGAVPYLTAVAFEGQFETEGVVPVSYGCGDGSIGITQQIGGNAVSGRSGQSGYQPGCSYIL